MHYFKGRNRWAIAIVFAAGLVLLAFVIQSANLERVPMAPGPLPTPTSIGKM